MVYYSRFSDLQVNIEELYALKNGHDDQNDSIFQDNGDLRGYIRDPGCGDSRTHAEGIQECTNCQEKSSQLRILTQINAMHFLSMLKVC